MSEMTRIIMHGCNGKMGQVISDIVSEDDGAVIVAGIDINPVTLRDYPVFANIKDCDVEADVIIDFAAPAAIPGLIEYSVTNNTPVVICTTGLSDEHLKMIDEASKKVAILKSANMSLGVNTILKLVNQISALLAEANFDIEIVEKHHNQKVDAPSGTALAIADSINAALNNEYSYKYDRSADRVKRPKKEIGISAVRGGTIVGEHEVIYAGTDEVIEIKHTAYSKAIFAKGAVSAAKFLNKKEAGMYDMSDVIG